MFKSYRLISLNLNRVGSVECPFFHRPTISTGNRISTSVIRPEIKTTPRLWRESFASEWSSRAIRRDEMREGWWNNEEGEGQLSLIKARAALKGRSLFLSRLSEKFGLLWNLFSSPRTENKHRESGDWTRNPIRIKREWSCCDSLRGKRAGVITSGRGENKGGGGGEGLFRDTRAFQPLKRDTEPSKGNYFRVIIG